LQVNLDAVGVAGLGQQFFGHGNILLERLQFKIFGMNGGDMVVLRHNPQSAMGDIKLSFGITGQLHGPADALVGKGLFGDLHTDHTGLG
jgi:hypothetical protein